MSTINKIKKILNNQIEQENEAISLYEKILSVIQKHNGQKITKRIETAVAKVLEPGWTVYYTTQHGMFHLKIRKPGCNYHDYSFLLGYDSDPYIRVGTESAAGHDTANRGFVSFNACYGFAARDRNKKRETALKDEKLLTAMASAIDKRNEAAKELEAFCDYDIPGWYTIEKIGTKEEKK